jgi:hypothetical protein
MVDPILAGIGAAAMNASCLRHGTRQILLLRDRRRC